MTTRWIRPLRRKARGRKVRSQSRGGTPLGRSHPTRPQRQREACCSKAAATPATTTHGTYPGRFRRSALDRPPTGRRRTVLTGSDVVVLRRRPGMPRLEPSLRLSRGNPQERRGPPSPRGPRPTVATARASTNALGGATERLVDLVPRPPNVARDARPAGSAQGLLDHLQAGVRGSVMGPRGLVDQERQGTTTSPAG